MYWSTLGFVRALESRCMGYPASLYRTNFHELRRDSYLSPKSVQRSLGIPWSLRYSVQQVVPYGPLPVGMVTVCDNLTVYAVMGFLVKQKECVVRVHVGHRPPSVDRVFSGFFLGTSCCEGGSVRCTYLNDEVWVYGIS